MPAAKVQIDAPPSYPVLQQLLRGMKASGKEDSFERLLANIITHLTGEQVYLAKSGSQLGDALSAKATIAIQTKRYEDSTPLDLNNIEGEVGNIAREVPQLEVYVLGATKSAQDIPRLSKIEHETGVSIVVVDWHQPDHSTLGQLCAFCWEAIRSLTPLNTLSDDWAHWISQEALKPEVIQKAEEIRRELLEEAALHSHVAIVCRQRLEKQFFPKSGEEQASWRFNQINLFQAIPREAMAQLKRWRDDDKAGQLAIVCGQEGMGKSWVASAFAHQTAVSSIHAVLWLKSRDWSACQRLKEVLEQAFRPLVNDRTLPRLVLKAIHKWQRPLLIVLDGVNERDALESAKNILRDWKDTTARDDHPPSHIRFLFTSRESAASELSAEDSSIRHIPVGPYSDEEMVRILPRLKQGLSVTEIPAPLLVQVARIPRYLPTCIRLLPELGGLQQVTVELVLWHDLLLRLREDAQVRKHLGIKDSEDAESILCRLARECTPDGEVSTKQLAEVFDADFRSIRHDLRELRWLSDARLGQPTTKISSDHLRLAWALYLRETLRAEAAIPADMEDRLQKTLEPLAGEDHRIAALRVCGRLSLTDAAGFGDDLLLMREALLRLWVKSRNISQVNEELSFWLDRDETFYLGFAERLLPELSFSDLRQRLVQPLVRAWSKGPSDTLISILTQWIQLIAGARERWSELDWPAHLEGNEVVIGEYRFPWVADETLLCLTGAAMTILSHRADPRMLRPLALAVATSDYSARHYPPPPKIVEKQGASAKGMWSSNKAMFELCGPLMRWAYGEAALPQLQRLINDHPADKLLKKGAQWMAAFLKLESVPSELSLPSGCRYFPHEESHPVEKLIEGRRLLDHCDNQGISNCIQRLAYYAPIGALACWDEVDWHPDDKVLLQEASPRLLGREALNHMHGNEICFAWLARWSPRAAAACAAQALCAFRFVENSILPDSHAIHVLPHPEERHSVLTCLRTILEDAPGNSYRTIAIWPGKYVALLLIEDEWQDWIQWLETKPAVRLSMNLLPVPEILSARLPLKVVSWLHERLLQIEFAPGTMGENDTATFLASLAISKEVPNPELYEKVKAWLKLNPQSRSMYEMLRLLISTAPDFASLLRDAELFSLSSHFRHYVQRHWSHIIAKGEVFAPDTPYERLVHFVPWDQMGSFLLRHGRMDEFKRWGGDVIEAAKAFFMDPTHVPLPRSPNQRRLNASGRVESVGPPATVIPGMTFVSSSTAWLAERSELILEDFLRSDQGQLIEEINQRNDAWREWFNDASNDPGNHSRHWLFFSARDEVMEWAARHPDEFRAKAIPFLTDPRYFDPNRGEIDSLISGVGRNFANAWFLLSPAAATEHFQKEPFFHVTETQHGFPTSYQQIWNLRLTSLPELAGRPRMELMEAKNDLEIAQLTWGAHLSGAEHSIFCMAQEWAGSEHMSERALAVSILAWIELPEALKLLQEIEGKDISRWVRQHARWAARVWKTENYAKRLFRHISQQREAWQASVMLAQLRPSLTRAAIWWMARELNTIWGDSSISSDIRALLHCSYYRRCSTSGNSEKVWDRDMKAYYRGDKLDSHSESLAPHWRAN